LFKKLGVVSGIVSAATFGMLVLATPASADQPDWDLIDIDSVDVDVCALLDADALSLPLLGASLLPLFNC
jgi:hypothetical protein